MTTFVLYKSAKEVRTVRANCLDDAVGQCDELTNPTFTTDCDDVEYAYQWFGDSAYELIARDESWY